MKLIRKLALILFLAVICLGLISAQEGDRPAGEDGKEGGKGGKGGGKGGKDGGKGGKDGGKGPPAGGRPGKDFTPAKQMKRGKVGCSFGKVGGAIRFCFDQDKCENAISMVFDKLVEVNATVNGTVVQRAKRFNDAEFEVSDPVTEQDSNGSYRVRVDYSGNISVGNNQTNFDKNATFKMISYIYLNASTAENGNQTIDIAKDTLKFSINITDWPWLDNNTDNFLSFGVQIAVRTRDGYKGPQKPEKKQGRGRGGKLARFELGDGEYLDVPELCVTDGVENTVQSSSEPLGDDGIIIDWVFPHFNNYVYYDPVMGQEAQVVEETDAPTTVAPTTTMAPSSATTKFSTSFVMTIGATMFAFAAQMMN